MREIHAFFALKGQCLSITCEFDASCVIFTHFLKSTLTLFIGVLAFWRVGITVALLASLGDSSTG
jgi:hypothetical protein